VRIIKISLKQWDGNIYMFDGNDLSSIHKAIVKAKKELNKPTIIEVKTTLVMEHHLLELAKFMVLQLVLLKLMN
jgi:hypothetical protein